LRVFDRCLRKVRRDIPLAGGPKKHAEGRFASGIDFEPRLSNEFREFGLDTNLRAPSDYTLSSDGLPKDNPERAVPVFDD